MINSIDQGFNNWQNAAADLIYALRVGVNAVRLIKMGVVGDAFQKKFIESDGMGFCKFGKNLTKLPAIFFAEVGGRQHPC